NAAYARQASAYFLQADYSCRHPLTARVLETLWQLPARPSECADAIPFLLDAEGGASLVRTISPSRVAAVHLLFAGPSGRSFSRFGHVGLRLLVCAPQRTVVDERCDEDLFEHMALGFRAGVDELDLSLWKGISGGYPIRLYAVPFMQAYSEYTTDEFRSLSSLPLKLDTAQRELLVRGLAEVHWAYQNDYRFFSRNCASELSWLLQVLSAVSAVQPAWSNANDVRPDRLYQHALTSPAFAADVMADLAEAERKGFYFPESRPYYQLALDTVQQYLPADVATDFSAFRTLDARTRRQQIYEPALQAADVPGQATLRRRAHAALVLEAWMERRQRRELLAAVARYYLDMTKLLLEKTSYFDDQERALLSRCLEGFRQADGVGRSVSGVPESPVLPVSGCDMRAPAFNSALAKLLQVAPPLENHQQKLAELQATVASVNWLLPLSGQLAGNESGAQGVK
ncbi:MAG: DUF4105 domain-containing protein, partial [Pedobacter sp.]|nr:DUF4105 domain-containing protein [Pedobacter sp.]